MVAHPSLKGKPQTSPAPQSLSALHVPTPPFGLVDPHATARATTVAHRRKAKVFSA
jgi:hypothetical protein